MRDTEILVPHTKFILNIDTPIQLGNIPPRSSLQKIKYPLRLQLASSRDIISILIFQPQAIQKDIHLPADTQRRLA